jgi:CheY-like chemotaxis protein
MSESCLFYTRKQTIRAIGSAMASDLTDKLLDWEDIIEMIDARNASRCYESEIRCVRWNERNPQLKGPVVAAILVVEDDEQVRVLAESVLRDAGHSVIAAAGAEGSQALLDTKRSIDVLFVDIRLGSDQEAGLKLAQSVKEQRPELCVLYTSGEAVNDGTKALFTKPSMFLPKPYTTEQLIKSISYLLRNANQGPAPTMPQPN